jgi:methyl-accepting chemotaxis protein
LETLLTIVVIVTGAALAVQAFCFVAIYLTFSRLSDRLDRFMGELRELMGPVRSISDNLKLASSNLVEVGLSARDQFRRVEAMVTTTGEALNVQLERFDRVTQNIMDRINETTEIIQESVVRPAREVAALAKGLSGFGSFFFKRGRSTVDQARQDEELFI